MSSGPVIDLRVNERIPGEELAVAAGSSVTVTATALGHADQVPLRQLEIVAHGRVVATVTPDESDQTTEQLSVEFDLPVERGIWIAARAWAGPQQAAHTTPVYVTVNEGGFYNPDTGLHNLDLSDGYLAELEQEIAQPNQSLNQHAWRFREGLEERIAETRERIAVLRAEFRAHR